MCLDEELLPFTNIPKIELHAHLNGSFSQNTLKKLIDFKKVKNKNDYNLEIDILQHPSKNLSDCFKIFSLIHNLTDNPEAVYMATCDVIREFSSDNVKYLELRTTPKENGSYMTQENYVDTVLNAIKNTTDELNGKINVKLLLSIDRKKDFLFAENTIKLAEKYFTCSQTIVGIDFSGDPTVGDVKIFIPLLEYARKLGLKLAIHISEVPDVNDEVKDLLKLYPHRLGHGTFLHPSKGGSMKNFSTLQELKIPLEICLTSNVISKTVPSYKDHHFHIFRGMNYPCILCTDDKGLFNTSLSREYCLASKYHSLTEKDLYNLSYNSIEYIFSSNHDKDNLKTLWKK